MITENPVLTFASWIVESFADPELLVVLVAGIAALGGFWVSARVAEVKARDDVRPADDLI